MNENYIARQKTGKGKFTARLVEAWQKMGMDITPDPKAKADIALHIGRCNYSSKAKKHVLRVGPANINTNMNWRKINKEKARSVKIADAIVYQSRYSKKIYHKLVCHPHKPETIIFNGADSVDYDVEPYTSNFKINFLASTRVWLKQKRLKTIIRSFLEAQIDNSYLIICGDTCGVEKKYEHHDNILFIGPVSDMVLAKLYRLCNAMIHITWLDACPNSVVEALVAGCPVICTNQGGTSELMFANDETYTACSVIPSDKPFEYKPVNLDKPPKSDDMKLMLRLAMNKYAIDPVRVKAPHLHIDNIARQYISFFEKIL